MKGNQSLLAVLALAAEVCLTTGCQSPDGTTNHTATGALVGGLFGAAVGLAAGGRHRAADAIILGTSGAIAGSLIGNAMDHDQRTCLRVYYPQTYQVVQYNEAAAVPAAAAPAAGTPPPAEPAPRALTLADIQALAAAGLKPEAINQEIELSHPKYSPDDLVQAGQSQPPLDPQVVECMKRHAG